MKKALYTLLFSLLFLSLSAQDFEIVSVESLPADMSAREEMKTDHSDRQCALLRMATQNIAPEQREGFTFKTDLGSEIVERANRNGEIWLWVSSGLKYLRIMHKDWGQYELRLPDYVARIEALHTYKVTIKGTYSPTSQVQSNTSPTQQYLVFQLTPPNATLEVDDQLWSVDADGVAMKYVNFGTYTYRVRASDYFTETGEVTVDDPNNTKTVPVSLRPSFATITLKVDADAEIWVNNVKKGVRSWTGQLGSGTYKIECKMASHETTMVSKEITTEMNGQAVILPAPKPIYGSLNIESTPNLCKLFIDGKEVGSTPKSIQEILIGDHELRLTRDGYNDYSETVRITNGNHTQIKATLNKDNLSQPTSDFVTNDGNGSDLVFTVNGVSFTMKLVEGFPFQMGSNHSDADDDEKPVHIVTVNTFYMGETEVTQALWKAVMGTNPSNWKGDNLPVESVSWDDCQEFIRKLNGLTGRNFRLPTEAEWEYAARGGIRSNRTKYAGSSNIGRVAWYDDNSGGKPHAVKGKSENELGLYDMSGNVSEWCSDWYGSDYYGKSPSMNPQGPSSGSHRVLRGGCWGNLARFCRVSNRNINDPDGRNSGNGFRLCLPQ